jgi:peroxiredoxin
MQRIFQPKRLILIATICLGVSGAAYLVNQVLSGVEKAPSVNYTLLNGSQLNTSQLQGKVVLVNFWATSCTTCVQEMPQLMATHEKFKARGFDTLAVAMRYDPPAYVINFAKTRQLPFGVAIDNTGEIANRFGQVQLTPTSFLINKRGDIVKRYLGAPDFAALHKLVEKLLAES